MSSFKAVKRKSCYIDDKMDAILSVDKGEKKSDIAKRLEIPLNTLSTWIKNKDKIFATYDESSPDRKRQRTSTYADVEQALLIWFTKARSNSVAVTGPILIAQARKFADALGCPEFQCSSGWLDRFKQRHRIFGKCITGESASVSDGAMSEWLASTLPNILRQFKSDDVYNMDETGIFFRMTPDKTLTFKGDPCHGGKKSKERITVAVCSNMVGSDKMELLVIGKFQNPRCFKNSKSLPVQYLANRKAWMTSDIFENWLRKLDRKFERESRKILLLVDNSPAHPKLKNLRAITLKFLPPNTTSRLQPMDQGIIQNLKTLYRRLVVDRLLHAVEDDQPINNNTVTLLDAIRMLHSAWNQVKPETIVNCFRHAGFRQADVGSFVTVSPIHFQSDTREIWDSLRSAGFSIPPEIAFEDYCDADNNLAVSGKMTEADVIESVISSRSLPTETDDDPVDDDDDICERRPPTAGEARNALTVLREWMEHNSEDMREGFRMVAQLENFIRSYPIQQQKTITDYFKKEHL